MTSGYFLHPKGDGTLGRVDRDEEPPPPPPPPPPTGGLYRPESTIFGMRFDRAVAASTTVPAGYKNVEGGWPGFDYINNEYRTLAGLPSGTRPMTLNRTYSGGMDFGPAAKGGRTGVHVHHSIKASKAQLAAANTTLRGQIYAYIDSLPTIGSPQDDGTTVYLTINHEPENDFSSGDQPVAQTWPPNAAQWRQGLAVFCKWVIDRRGLTKRIVPVPVVMDWTVNHNNDGNYVGYANPWDTVNLAPELEDLDVDIDQVCFGIDHYRLSPTTTNNNILLRSIQLVKSWGFSRVCFPEFGGKSYTTADRTAWKSWIRHSAQIFVDQNVETVQYYLSNNGNGSRPNQTGNYEGWFIYGDDNKILWTDICRGEVP